MSPLRSIWQASALVLLNLAGCDNETRGNQALADGGDASPSPSSSTRVPSLPVPAEMPTPPPLPPARPPAPTTLFPQVDEAEWAPRLGPKMAAGSRVIHTVFKGPFGPSPETLIAVTKTRENQYMVLLMGDDGRPWPAGPLGNDAEHSRGVQVAAVSFFDADGDGTTDMLVVAEFEGFGQRYYANSLLRWTPKGMRRMLQLESSISNMTSVDAVRRTLGR